MMINKAYKFRIYPNKTQSSIGMDVGLKDFAILSDGTIYKNPKFFQSLEEKLAKAQRVLSRRTKNLIAGINSEQK